VALNPVANLALTGSEDGEVRLWDLARAGTDPGRVLWKAPVSKVKKKEGARGQVNAVAFSADGKLLAAGSGDRKVRVWKVEDVKPSPRPTLAEVSLPQEVQAVEFTRDGQSVLIALKRHNNAGVVHRVRLADSKGPREQLVHPD